MHHIHDADDLTCLTVLNYGQIQSEEVDDVQNVWRMDSNR